MKYILILLLLPCIVFGQSKKKKTKTYKAKCIEIHDGDTVKLDIDLDYEGLFHRSWVRLYGIDSPELTAKDSNKVPDLTKRALAIIATDTLNKLILNKEVIYEVKGKDKYNGRGLGNIYLIENKDTISINNIMLNFSKSYYGGKKQ